MEVILRRDRAIVLLGMAGVAVLGWAALLHEGSPLSCGRLMAGPSPASWRSADLALLFAMWAVMMVAMMVPSAAPMVLTFAAVNRTRRERSQPFVPTAVFLLGYVAAWTAFSALATLAQWALHVRALLSPMMVMTSPRLGGTLLMAAGVFQFTPLKRACLVRCRNPLSFLMTEWRDGVRGAFLMGLRHGSYCIGCCWLLMILLFVAGVMNLLWVAAIAGLVLAEKAAPEWMRASRVAGLLLMGWGAWLVAGATLF